MKHYFSIIDIPATTILSRVRIETRSNISQEISDGAMLRQIQRVRKFLDAKEKKILQSGSYDKTLERIKDED